MSPSEFERSFAGSELTWKCLHVYPLDVQILASNDQEIGQINRERDKRRFTATLCGIDWKVTHKVHLGRQSYLVSFSDMEEPIAIFSKNSEIHFDDSRLYRLRRRTLRVSTITNETEEILTFQRHGDLGPNPAQGKVIVSPGTYEPDLPGLIILGLSMAYDNSLFKELPPD